MHTTSTLTSRAPALSRIKAKSSRAIMSKVMMTTRSTWTAPTVTPVSISFSQSSL
jgi:hypothetical protein